MGFLSDLLTGGEFSPANVIFGADQAAAASLQAASTQAEAPRQAAELQRLTTQDVIKSQEAAAETARADLQPFRQAGQQALPGLQTDLEGIRGLVTDPTKQAEFVQNNPFFDLLAEDAQRRLFNNQAARGKLGSGGTAEALQNSILLLGNDLVNQNVAQRQGVFQSGLNIASLGSNAAAGQANITQGTGANIANTSLASTRNIGDLLTQGANATAAGIVGASNAQQQAQQAAVNTGLGIGSIIALSDRREKENITFVGKVRGIPYYLFNYIGDKKTQLGTMAQDVEHIANAVLDFGGKKYVDYGVI